MCIQFSVHISSLTIHKHVRAQSYLENDIVLEEKV